jgi:hypothetical protein
MMRCLFYQKIQYGGDYKVLDVKRRVHSTETVTSIAITPDGGGLRIISGGRDGYLNYFSYTVEPQIKHIKSVKTTKGWVERIKINKAGEPYIMGIYQKRFFIKNEHETRFSYLYDSRDKWDVSANGEFLYLKKHQVFIDLLTIDTLCASDRL